VSNLRILVWPVALQQLSEMMLLLEVHTGVSINLFIVTQLTSQLVFSTVAPEVIEQSGATTASDIWCVVFVLIHDFPLLMFVQERGLCCHRIVGGKASLPFLESNASIVPHRSR
jgi:hypothetical protein